MNTKNIMAFFENDSISNKHFIGVFARDELPKKLMGLGLGLGLAHFFSKKK
jgi:hypothetical protein